MLTPESMTKVRIIGSKGQMPKVINELYNLKALHISEFTREKSDTFDLGKPYKEAEGYSTHLVKLRSMMSFLKISGDGRKLAVSDNSSKLYKIEKEFGELSKNMEELQSKQKILEDAVSNPLSRLAHNKIIRVKSLKTFTGVVNKNFLKNTENLTFGFDLTKEEVSGKLAIIFTVPVTAEENARELLEKSGFEEKQIPEISYDDASKSLQEIKNGISDVGKKFDEFKKENSKFIVNIEHSLNELIEKSEAPLKFATSKRAFVVEGWVPTNKLDVVEKRISNVAKEKISLEILETEETPPAKLDNPKTIQPFEMFLDMNAYPGKYDFDPTIILSFTFSMFFGFMLGDMGYGLLLLIVSILAFRKLKGTMKSLSYILLLSSFFTILFGGLFGEFFGFDIIKAQINRFHEVNKMITISIILGFIHISTGLVLGFITKFKEHGLMHAILEKGSWLIMEMAAVSIALGVMMGIATLTYVGAFLMLSSIAMIIKGEGIKGAIEIPGLFSNILSYMRLFAVGLASVALAVVVNDIAVGMFKNGLVGFFTAALVFVLGHSINMMLGIIGPFLHSLRLHYFEFFTKFFEGGGKPYYPFGKINKWR